MEQLNSSRQGSRVVVTRKCTFQETEWGRDDCWQWLEGEHWYRSGSEELVWLHWKESERSLVETETARTGRESACDAMGRKANPTRCIDLIGWTKAQLTCIRTARACRQHFAMDRKVKEETHLQKGDERLAWRPISSGSHLGAMLPTHAPTHFLWRKSSL